MEIFGVVSSRTRRALWTAEEAGADYTFRALDFRKAEHRSPEYLAMNPNGRVPTMRDGDLVLFESAAICRYIASKYPEAGLLPQPGTHDAALHDQWVCWTITELEQPLWSMGKHRFALPKEQRIPEMLKTARWEWDRAVKVLADAFEDGRQYVVGERFHMVDVLVAHTLLWARGFGVPTGSPLLEAYLDRMLERPAFLATKALG